MQNIKITTPEELALHALISVIAGALLAAGIAIVGVVSKSGIDFPLLWTAGIGGFGTAFGAGFLAFRNNPNTKQAEIDLAGQATQIATSVEARIVPQLEARFQGLLNWLQQPSQVPAQVQAPPAQSQPVPPIPVQQVVQQPFPSSSTFPMPIVPKQPGQTGQ